MRFSPNGRLEALASLLCFLLICAPLAAAQHSGPQSDQDAEQLARDIFHNEVQEESRDRSLWCYRELKAEDGAKKLFGVCETKRGEIDRLLAVNGRPLDEKQRRREDARIQKSLGDSQQLREKEKKKQEDGKQAQKLMSVFSRAFRFHYQSKNGDFVRLRFEPAPDFHPSGHEEQVFHHLQGSVLLDTREKRLAEIDGKLMSEVKFAGGLLGHLNKGGTFHVEQKNVGSRYWELTKLNVQMDGKALFFKTISVRQFQEYSAYKEIHDGMSLQQAFEFLKQDPQLAQVRGN